MNKDYIEFRHGYGCYSLAGRNGQRQEIVLDPRCGEKHTLIHEVNSVDNYILLKFNNTPTKFLQLLSDFTRVRSITRTSTTRPR